MSIDALRGFDMFWIIGGWSIFRSLHEKFDNSTTQWLSQQLSHVKWEGFRPWDLIMPLFLFVVGVVMPFAFNKRLAVGQSKKRLYFHIIIRTLILFILGMIAQGRLLTYDLSKLRIYSNTLQAIAAGYLISAIILLNLRLVWQIVTTVVLLLLFWALMMLVPVPGHDAGMLEPDVNLAIYLDRLILGGFIDGTDPPYTWILSGMTFGNARSNGRALIAFGKEGHIEGLIPPGSGRGLFGARFDLEYLVSYHQAPVDQFLRALFSRMVLPAVGIVLSGYRCVRF